MNLQVKHQLILAFIAISILSVLITALLIGTSAISESKVAIQQQVEQKLISTRDQKKVQIQDYFQLLGKQVRTLSASPWIRDASTQLTSAFNQYPAESNQPLQKQYIYQYYQQQFGPQYAKQNNGESPDLQTLFSNLSAPAAHLQQGYIINNPNALGQKEALMSNSSNTNYDRLHQRYHPTLLNYLQTYQYYDIFIVEPKQGHVIYSVFKELDYGTSLINGPYKDSGLALTYQKAMQLEDGNAIVVTDFVPYLPSYNSAAAFIASPIMDNDKKVGVLIFQMPIDAINDIMTNQQQWRDVGFGGSGETYLVGSDSLLRSQSRFLVEQPEAYLAALKKTASPMTLAQIAATNTAIGLQEVNTLVQCPKLSEVY